MSQVVSAQTAVKIAVVGHSYITQLEEFVLKSESRTNLGLPFDQMLIRFFGVNGGSLERHSEQSICQVLDGPDSVNAFKPAIVFIHVGENDVPRMDSGSLTECYFDFCDQLASINSVRSIVLSCLLPFPVIVRDAAHDACLCQCNMVLKASSPEIINVDQAFAWSHKLGLRAPDAETRKFHIDGFHMNDVLGINKYYHSVRTAVAYARRKLLLRNCMQFM